MAVHPLRPATDRCLGRPLPCQPANQTRAHPVPPEFFTLGDVSSCAYAVLAAVSSCYPPVQGRLPTRYSPVHATKLKHPLLLANADNHFMEQRIPSSLFSEHRNPHHVKPISLNSIILSVINNTGWACLPECVANRFSGICKILPFKGINTSHYVTMCWRTEPANYMLNKLAEMICQEFHKK